MADNEVSKVMWIAVVVALAAVVFAIAKPEINTLTHEVFDNIGHVVNGIDTDDSSNENEDGTFTHTAYAWSADGKDRFTLHKPQLNLLNSIDYNGYSQDTTNLSGSTLGGGTTFSEVKLNGSSRSLHVKSNGPKSQVGLKRIIKSDLKLSDVESVTVSIKAKTSNTSDLSISNMIEVKNSAGKVTYPTNGDSIVEADGNWHEISYTVDLPKDIDPNYIGIYSYGKSKTSAVDYEIGSLDVKIGDKVYNQPIRSNEGQFIEGGGTENSSIKTISDLNGVTKALNFKANQKSSDQIGGKLVVPSSEEFVKVGDVFTVSGYVKNNTSNLLKLSGQSWVTINGTPNYPKSFKDSGLNVEPDGKWHYVTYSVKVPEGADPSNFGGYFYTQTGMRGEVDFDIAAPKVERGEFATPWMPSKSEVKDTDYPGYVGTYTDKNETSSENPSDYTWTKIK